LLVSDYLAKTTFHYWLSICNSAKINSYYETKKMFEYNFHDEQIYPNVLEITIYC